MFSIKLQRQVFLHFEFPLPIVLCRHIWHWPTFRTTNYCFYLSKYSCIRIEVFSIITLFSNSVAWAIIALRVPTSLPQYVALHGLFLLPRASSGSIFVSCSFTFSVKLTKLIGWRSHLWGWRPLFWKIQDGKEVVLNDICVNFLGYFAYRRPN